MARRMVRIVALAVLGERLRREARDEREGRSGSPGSSFLKGSPSAVARYVSPERDERGRLALGDLDEDGAREAAREGGLGNPGVRQEAGARARRGRARRRWRRRRAPLSPTMASAVRRSLPTTSISVTAKRGLVITWRRADPRHADGAAATTSTTPARCAARTRMRADGRDSRRRRRARGGGATSIGREDGASGGDAAAAERRASRMRRPRGHRQAAPTAWRGARARSR